MDINRYNYESYFLSYLDRELSPADRQSVEKFISENTDLQKEFELLQQTIFSPSDLVFDGKESLLRKEEGRKVIPIYWMRMAAAIAVLILGSWFIISQITKSQVDHMIPVDKRTASATAVKRGSGTFKKDSANKIPANPSGGEAAAGKKPGSNQKATFHTVPKNVPEIREIQTSMVSEEGVAVQKSSTALELQSGGIKPAGDPKQIIVMPVATAPVLLIAASGTKDAFKKEKGDVKETDFQNENAISVIALNDKHKAISGFFKKLTERAPGDDNERKVRVSVFQFSY